MLQITNKGGKDMKKIGILLIALMVISVGFLSGCEEKEESYSIILTFRTSQNHFNRI